MKENSATLAAQGQTEHQKIIDQAYKLKKPSLDSSSFVLASSTSASAYYSTISDIVILSCDSVSSVGTNAPKKRKNTDSADDVNVNINTGTPKIKKNSKSAKVKSALMVLFSKILMSRHYHREISTVKDLSKPEIHELF